VRAPVDALLRDRLQAAGISFEVIYGLGQQRLQATIKALRTINSIAPRATNTRASSLKGSENTPKLWVWTCDKCSDPDCEHQLFTRLTAKAAS
jgi:hypothetical protein